MLVVALRFVLKWFVVSVNVSSLGFLCCWGELIDLILVARELG